MAAFTAQLKRGGSTYSLSVVEEWEPPKIAASVSVVGGRGGSDPRLVREQLGTTVALTVPLYISDSSKANLVAEVDTLNAFLRGGACQLEVTFTDSAAATVWNVLHAQPVQPTFAHSAELKYWVMASLELLVSPFVETAEVTLYTAEALTTPDSLDLSTMAGTFRTPLTIDWNATSADTHALYLALDASSFDDYMTNAAADVSWGAGFTDYADGDAFATNATKFASTSYVTGTIDTAAYPEGLYLLLARVKANGGATGTIDSDYTTPAVTFTRSTFHIVELGYCHLPTRQVRNAGTANLTVSVKSSSAAGGSEAVLDWVYALPLADGAFWWHHATAATGCDTLGRDAADGITYVDDVADEQHVSGTTLMALGGTLLIVGDAVAGGDPTHDGALTVKYTPRYGWMR